MRKIFAFGRAPPRHRDPVRQIAVATSSLSKQHQTRMRLPDLAFALLVVRQREPHLAADDQMQLAISRLDVCADNA